MFCNDVDNCISISCIFDVNVVFGYFNFVGFEINSWGQCVLVFCYYNVNKVCIQGVEIELKVLFNEVWKLLLNYIYNDGCDVSNGGNKLFFDLLFYIVNGMFDWKLVQFEDWLFYVLGNYIGCKWVDSVMVKMLGGYVVWDIGVVWQVMKNVKLCVGVLNVGDKDFKCDDYGYIEDGCCYFMVVDYCF